jgi:hypothetical protein
MRSEIFRLADNGGPYPETTPVPAPADADLALAPAPPFDAAECIRRAYDLGRQHQAELDRLETEFQANLMNVYATRKATFNLPLGPIGEGYLYVVGFTTGYVKVGQTEDPRVRLPAHRNEAAAFGVHIKRAWVSPPHRNFLTNETLLIAACKEVSARSRREYFHTVGFDQAVQFAANLDYFSDAPAELRELCHVWGVA